MAGPRFAGPFQNLLRPGRLTVSLLNINGLQYIMGAGSEPKHQFHGRYFFN